MGLGERGGARREGWDEERGEPRGWMGLGEWWGEGIGGARVCRIHSNLS